MRWMIRVTDAAGKCDVVLLVALQEEADTLRHALPFAIEATGPFETLQCWKSEFSAIGGHRRRLRIIVVGEVGDRIRETISGAVARFAPEFVINIGISGKVGKDTRVGDVVIPTEFINYAHRSKANSGDLLEFGGRFLHADLSIKAVIDKLHGDGKTALSDIASYCRRDEQAPLTDPENAAIATLQSEGNLRKHPALVSGIFAVGPVVVKSEQFAAQLQLKSPDIIAVDMESGAALDALRTLQTAPRYYSIRAISDPGSQRKGEFDAVRSGLFRRWAVSNVGRVLQELLPALPYTSSTNGTGDSLRQRGRAFAEKQAIAASGSRIQDLKIGLHLNDYFANLYENIPDQGNERALFGDLVRKLKNAPPGSNFVVRGNGGCGKTALLYLLYQSLLLDGGNVLPLYLDVPQCISPGGNAEFRALLQQAKQEIDALSDVQVIVFMDGCISDPSERQVSQDLGKAMESHEPIVFYGFGIDHQRILFGRGVELDLFIENLNFEKEYELKAVSVQDSEQCLKIVQGILTSRGGRSLASSDLIWKSIAKHGFSYVNHFLISLLIENLTKERYRKITSGTEFILEAMRERFRSSSLPKEVTFDSICIEALSMHSETLRKTSKASSASRTAYNEMFANQPRIAQTALIARGVSHLLVALGEKREAELERFGIHREAFFSLVYDNDVCRNVKDIMRNPTEQRRLIAAAAAVLKADIHRSSLSFCIYVLGRATDAHSRQVARQALLGLHVDLVPKALAEREASIATEELKFLQLAARSVYISLAYYEDANTTEEYLNRLMTDRIEDELNRAFHLEYYRDISSGDISVDLVFEDRSGKWNRTKGELLRFIRRAITEKRFSQIDRIRLVTYFSFVRRRHEQGRLEGTERDEAQQVLKEILGMNRGLSGAAVKYARMLARNLKHDRFHALAFLVSIYKLKALPRRGWRKRGICKEDWVPESVGAHTFGVSTLAELIVDRTVPEWRNVDEAKLRSMILFHDVGEFEVGDYTPDEKHSIDEEQEVEYLSSMSCYDGLTNLSFLLTNFQEYENKSTPEAKLAFQLDKLDALIQAYIYKDRFSSLDDYLQFTRDQLRHITSPRLLKIVEPIEGTGDPHEAALCV